MSMRRWAGRIAAGWVVVFLLFDAGVKVLNSAVAVEATTRLGYPAHLVPVIGLIELAVLVLYVIPATSILGAVLLTGFLGGATATQVRVGDPWLVFPVLVGALVWGALWLRDSRIGGLLLVKEPRAATEDRPSERTPYSVPVEETPLR